MSIADDGQMPAQNKCFVGQLPVDIREDEIRMIFSTYGTVEDVAVIDGKPAGTNKVAIVKYTEDSSAHTAIQALNDVYKFRPDAEFPIKVSIQRVKARDKGCGKGKDHGKDGNGFYGGGG